MVNLPELSIQITKFKLHQYHPSQITCHPQFSVYLYHRDASVATRRTDQPLMNYLITPFPKSSIANVSFLLLHNSVFV